MRILSYFKQLLVTSCMVAVLSSCAAISYYGQSISGQIKIISAQQPIAKLVSDPTLPQNLKDALQLAQDLRAFANSELLLPVNGNYKSYADIGQEYVIWNVIATPEFSLEPLQWCFLYVGCLTYRGYFTKQTAVKFAGKLQAQGHDVHIGGVSAYSTLGWFDDPVLNTMLQDDEIYLARVIFHELAHQLLYIKNDTAFNEAFADAVAETGVRRWLEKNNRHDLLEQFEETIKREREFEQLVNKYKRKLEFLYNSDLNTSVLRSQKMAIFKLMVKDYEKIQMNRNDLHAYRAWFDNGLNNAKLAIVLTYRELAADFLRLLQGEGNDLNRFYLTVSRLAHCSKEERRQFLNHGLEKPVCSRK